MYIPFRDIKAKMLEMYKPALMVGIAYCALALVTATDVLIISWLGIEQLAAAGFVVRIYFPFFIFAVGFSLPVLAMCGKALGENNHQKVRSIFQHSLMITLAISLLSVFIAKYIIRGYLNYIDQPQRIIDYAVEYGDIFFWAIPLVVWASSARAIMSVLDYVKPFMILNFTLVVLNGILDYVLVFGFADFIPAMGLTGAAIATIIVNVFYLTVLGLLLLKKSQFKDFKFLTQFENIKLSYFKEIFIIGVPLSIRRIVDKGLSTYYYTLMAGFGLFYLGAYNVAYQIESLAICLAIGSSTIISAQVGIANGRKSVREILTVSYAGILLMLTKISILGLTIMIFAPLIVAMFLGGSESYEDIKPIAIKMLIIVATYQIVQTFYYSLLSAMDGMGLTQKSSTIHMSSLAIFGAGGAYVLSQTSLGGYGILLACLGSYVMSFFLLAPLFVKYIKKYEKDYD